MKKVFFESQYVKLASSFESKNFYLGRQGTSKDFVRSAPLSYKSHVKIRLKYIISPKRKKILTRKYRLPYI